MVPVLRHPLTRVWLLLTVITVIAWQIAAEHGTDRFHPSTGVSVAVVLIAAAKVRFVIRHFMEVRTAPAWLQRSCDAWLLATTALILFLV